VTSPGFSQALRLARERIWIVDAYLYDPCEVTGRSFFHAFNKPLVMSQADDIRLIGNSRLQGAVLQAVKSIENDRLGRRQFRPHQIECRCFGSKRDGVLSPHDRFAIIDEELWHWGASVGGTHHQVNAYSRGWPAAEKRANAYFERLWGELQDQRR
jgi:hypothetical protein